MHITKSEVHLGLLREDGVVQLNVHTGALIPGNIYGSEDWRCGAWSIQRRMPNGEQIEIFRFKAQPIAKR